VDAATAFSESRVIQPEQSIRASGSSANTRDFRRVIVGPTGVRYRELRALAKVLPLLQISLA